jgi:diaminohydroxyphosphoribosylaminopyrimidine deaminase/5-amino-6-(5-phosphoribosylamino)uracil reductase
MAHDRDRQLLRRAIRLAMNGRGAVEPNPMVGCVIARDDTIIGEGFHARFGGPHAEPTALDACSADSRGATAYVTLEPCCHTNKKTPPCAPRLIAAGIARVVVGCLDPNPPVNGGGLAMLRAAGVRVDVADVEIAAECRQLLAPFRRVLAGRAYVTAKWAESADRRVAGAGGTPLAISGERSRSLVHTLRSRCDAIVVGIGTALADDPLLTARGVASSRPRRRVVLDRSLRLPPTSRLASTAREHPTIVCCETGRNDGERRGALESLGVIVLPLDEVTLASALAAVIARDGPLTHVLVEPGPTLARSLFEAGVIDRLWVFRSPRIIGDPRAPLAPDVPATFVETGRLTVGDDTLIEHLDPRSDCFAAAVASADLVLAASEGVR